MVISVFSKDARDYYRLDDFYNGVNAEENKEEIE